MKIVLTGGGTGGHFYPIIAVAEEINAIAHKEKIAELKMFYLAPAVYNRKLLRNQGIEFRKIPAGKFRLYFSLKNFTDLFLTAFGVIKALWVMFFIFPDVVFSKGSYVSFPVLMAARFYKIPIVIHESDRHPGRANMWAKKFARKIAISYPGTSEFFPAEKTAFTGNPIRKDLQEPLARGAREYLSLEEEVPVILIIGGSQGSQMINRAIYRALGSLVEKYYVIHQVGEKNFENAKLESELSLKNSMHKDRYIPFAYMDDQSLRMAAGIASLIISRAGSSIFEIASWGVPSIIIPITNSHGDHQRKNAYSYARTGAALVIEESNLREHVFLNTVKSVMENREKREEMAKATESFRKPEAAYTIARELVSIGLQHEK